MERTLTLSASVISFHFISFVSFRFLHTFQNDFKWYSKNAFFSLFSVCSISMLHQWVNQQMSVVDAVYKAAKECHVWAKSFAFVISFLEFVLISEKNFSGFRSMDAGFMYFDFTRLLWLRNELTNAFGDHCAKQLSILGIQYHYELSKIFSFRDMECGLLSLMTIAIGQILIELNK